MALIGIVGTAAATGLYLGSQFGPGPRDGLMTGLAARTGLSLRLVRTVIEVSVVLVGWLLGGPLGPATILFALTIGPLTQWSLRLFAVRLSDRQGCEQRGVPTPHDRASGAGPADPAVQASDPAQPAAGELETAQLETSGVPALEAACAAPSTQAG